MNKNEKNIDKLTRDLLKGMEVVPSTSLNMRIMGMITKEKRKRVYSYVERQGITFKHIFWLIAYVLLAGGLLYTLFLLPDGTGQMADLFSSYFPILLTIASGIACFFLFVTLDGWLSTKDPSRFPHEK